MGDEPNYRATNVPEDKPPSEYSYVERRAETLQLIEEAGHPRAISQTRLADRYDVSQGQISQDIDRLRTHIVENIDETTVDSITETVYQKSVQELMSNGEYKDAVKAVESWNDWLMDRGKVEKEPDKHEVVTNGIAPAFVDADE
jgi:hypothetical protein